MKEYTSPLGRKIYVFENVIPKDICQILIPQIPKDSLGKYSQNRSLAIYLNSLYKAYCSPSPVQFVGYTDKVTYGASSKTIPYHTDPHDKKTQQWKVLFYLNTVSNGGTIFRESGQDIPVDNSEGTVVLFDTNIPHLGNPKQSSTDIKYTTGFFPLTAENDIYFKSHDPNFELIWINQIVKIHH